MNCVKISYFAFISCSFDLVLRVNYDVDMTNYDDWVFNTGNAATNKPVLTLTYLPVGNGVIFNIE
jgi:hypothetical protein